MCQLQIWTLFVVEDAKKVTREIGERLREWRRSMEKTQGEMAALLSVNISVLRKYELGLNAPGGLLLTVACQRGLSINWLLTGQGPMTQQQATSSCPTCDAVLAQLCSSLEKLRTLDPEKYQVLSMGFIARSDEAGEHAALKRSALQKEGFAHSGYMDDILSVPMDLYGEDSIPGGLTPLAPGKPEG